MIRQARPDHAGTMGAILSDWIDDTPWMPRLHSRAEDRQFCLHLVETTTVWVHEKDHLVGGFLACDGADLQALYLAPQARGQGRGKALLDTAKAASAGMLRLWTFQANTAAVHFYVHEGFAEVGRTDGARNAETLPDVQLEWRA